MADSLMLNSGQWEGVKALLDLTKDPSAVVDHWSLMAVVGQSPDEAAWIRAWHGVLLATVASWGGMETDDRIVCGTDSRDSSWTS